MVEQSTRESPLGHRAFTPPDGAVRIREAPFLTQLNLRVDPEGPAAALVAQALDIALPSVNSAARSGDVDVFWLGPDEWLVVTAARPPAELQRQLQPVAGSPDVVVVDLSAHRTTIELSGARARDVLAKGCSLDLHEFVPGRCAQTLLARAPVVLAARDGEHPTYWLLVRASLATYLADWLLDAGAEYVQAGS